MKLNTKKSSYNTSKIVLVFTVIRIINHSTEVYSEPCQTTKMKCLTKIVNGLKPLTIFAKRFIFDV